MTELALKSINTAMTEMGLNYGFMRYDVKPIVYPYFVGEYIESPTNTEDGLQEATFILTGFCRGNSPWQSLESAKQTIEHYFSREGKVYSAADGTKAVVMYNYAFPVPKEEADLQSLQINLDIKEWKVI